MWGACVVASGPFDTLVAMVEIDVRSGYSGARFCPV